MKVIGVELRTIKLPLVSPFRTSFGTQVDREVLLLRVETADAEGWGECVAMSDPLYSSEYIAAAADVLRRLVEHRLAFLISGGTRTGCEPVMRGVYRVLPVWTPVTFA